MFAELQQLLDHLLWHIDLNNANKVQAFLVRALRIFYGTIQDLKSGLPSLRAMSLVYTTLLSIVPLLKGGGLFETGAGGSAPKHVQQLIKEGHLRWDSLGEYCALVPSFEMIADQTGSEKAAVLARTLDQAIARYLENGKLPGRKVNELDNRGSTYYLTLYWAQALASQNEDADMKARFAVLSEKLAQNEARINTDLLAAQGHPVDLGGYYMPVSEKASQVMRPSVVLNEIIDSF